MTLDKILLSSSLIALYILLIVPFLSLGRAAKHGDRILGIKNYYKKVGD